MLWCARTTPHIPCRRAYTFRWHRTPGRTGSRGLPPWVTVRSSWLCSPWRSLHQRYGFWWWVCPPRPRPPVPWLRPGRPPHASPPRSPPPQTHAGGGRRPRTSRARQAWPSPRGWEWQKTRTAAPAQNCWHVCSSAPVGEGCRTAASRMAEGPWGCSPRRCFLFFFLFFFLKRSMIYFLVIMNNLH